MTAPAPDLRRVVALLADRALEGLDSAEQQELDGLLASFPDLDAGVLDRTAAQIEVVLGRSAGRLAVPVRRALLEDVGLRFGQTSAAPRVRATPQPVSEAAPVLEGPAVPEQAPAPAGRSWARLGLAAAAGGVVMLALLWLAGLLTGS